MTLGTTPLSNVTIGNNQIPASAVAVPNHVSGNLTTLRGANPSTDSNGNETADASVAIPDGANITQGLIADAAVTGDTAGTVSAKLRGMNKTLAAAFLDTFGSAGNITAATTFSGVPTASQLVTNSWVFLANPGGQSTFLIALEVGSAFNGTISFYGLEPDATSLQLISAHQRGASTIASSVAINVGAATNQVWAGNIANFKGVYAVCTARTSGTLSAQLGLSPAPYAVSVTSANLTTISGQAPTLDNTSTLAVSIRGKHTTAGDTPVSVDASGNVGVNVQGTVPVSGTVTANAGTNLNTSLLAVESGGNLATLAGGVTSSKYQMNIAQVLGATLSASNPNINEANVQNWIRVGAQGYFASSDFYTPANTNNALSLYNPNASGKTLVVLSLSVAYSNATQKVQLRLANSDPNYANALTHASFDLGNLNTSGGTSPVANATYATASTSPPSLSASSIALFAGLNQTTIPFEAIPATMPLVLAANSGVALYIANTAAGSLAFNIKWIEI